MPDSLKDLICTELSSLASTFELVPSEETLKIIMLAMNRNLVLKQAQLVSIYKLDGVLNGIITRPYHHASHYQFLVEFGRRDNKVKGNRGSAHYAALDLYTHPEHPPLALFVDHERGTLDDDLKAILNKLKIKIAYVGGKSKKDEKLIYQADGCNCAFFSLYQLNMSAQDTELPARILQLEATQTEQGAIFCHWYQLPPQYLVNAQSVQTTLFDFIDTTKEKEGLPAFAPSRILSQSIFPQTVGRSLVVSPTGKMLNLGINRFRAHVAGLTRCMLDSDLPAPAIIDLCYRERYPLVFDLLLKITESPIAHPDDIHSGIVFQHPYFELSFSAAHILEQCLRSRTFKSIFLNETVLHLISKKLLDPEALLRKLTLLGKGLEPNEGKIAVVQRTITQLNKLGLMSDKTIELFSPTDWLELLSCSNTHKVLAHPQARQLLIQKKMPVAMLATVDTSRLSLLTANMNTLEIEAALSPVATQQDSDEDKENDLFDIFTEEPKSAKQETQLAAKPPQAQQTRVRVPLSIVTNNKHNFFNAVEPLKPQGRKPQKFEELTLIRSTSCN